MIELIDIKKSFTNTNVRTDVLKGVSLYIEDGEFVMIVGKSGCGKTTLLNIIGCMEPFDSGTYYLNGNDIKSMSERSINEMHNRNIGYVPQTFCLNPKLDLVDNVALPLRQFV